MSIPFISLLLLISAGIPQKGIKMASIMVSGISIDVSTLKKVDEFITFSPISLVIQAKRALVEKVASFKEVRTPEREIFEKALEEVSEAV